MTATLRQGIRQHRYKYNTLTTSLSLLGGNSDVAIVTDPYIIALVSLVVTI